MSSDRRTAPRIELMGRLHGRIASLDVDILVREISLGGLSMETSVYFADGSIHEFRLRLGDESAVLLRGRIVHCRKVEREDGSPVYVSGVQFVDEDEGPHDQVDGIINQIQ